MARHIKPTEETEGAQETGRPGTVEEGGTAGGDPAGTGNRKRKVILVVILVVCVLVALFGLGTLFMMYTQQQRALEEQEAAPEPAVEVEDEGEDELEPNPIDFTELQSKTPDAHAWLYVPGTNVNVPVLRSPVDDNFYLDHNAEGDYDPVGAAFTQSMNALDFSDPVTVIYGHRTDNGAMFGSLLNYMDADFFESHPDLYIYTPGHILHYEVISAYIYDDRHIMNSFDFSDAAVRQQYFDSVLNPTSMTRNVREGATLDADSKIVQLSTCPTAPTNHGHRFIVTGVLVDDQPTL